MAATMGRPCCLLQVVICAGRSGLEMVVVIRMFTLRECVCAVDEGRVGLCALCRLYYFRCCVN